MFFYTAYPILGCLRLIVRSEEQIVSDTGESSSCSNSGPKPACSWLRRPHAVGASFALPSKRRAGLHCNAVFCCFLKPMMRACDAGTSCSEVANAFRSLRVPPLYKHSSDSSHDSRSVGAQLPLRMKRANKELSLSPLYTPSQAKLRLTVLMTLFQLQS